MRIFRRKYLIILAICLIAPFLLLGIALATMYHKQEKIVQHFLTELNEDINGFVVINKSKVTPFANFPYISIDLQGFYVFEDAETMSFRPPVISLKDVYIGFDIMEIIRGNTEIKSLSLNHGDIDIVQDSLGDFNISKAFELRKPVEEVSAALQLTMEKIKLKDVDISKTNLESMLTTDVYINQGDISIKMRDDKFLLRTKSDFFLSVIQNGDSTFFSNKNCNLSADILFDLEDLKLEIQPSTLVLETTRLSTSGIVDFKNDLYLDIQLVGDKPNFDFFLTFAPDDLAKTLRRYDNGGTIFFRADIKGNALNSQPHVEADFGCENTFISNQFSKKKVDQLQFKGYYTNGEGRSLESSIFTVRDFAARPEAGRFKGALSVKNFKSPEIDMQIDSDFNLEFLTQFFEFENVYQLSGQVLLQMNFHDIVDLNHPERSLEKLDQAYFAKLQVNDLSFVSPDFSFPSKNINIAAETKGNDLVIEKIDINLGVSDIHLEGTVTNLPEILHHTDVPMAIEVSLKSRMLDIRELAHSVQDTTVQITEKIKNLSTHFKFTGSAKDLTEYKNLPKGRFVLDEFNAVFKNYPHHFHDFNVDVSIEDERIILYKFHGEIDESDMDIHGSITNYGMFMEEKADGDTDISFSLKSESLILKDLLSYEGVNYLSDEYRQEVLTQLKCIGKASLHYKDSALHSSDVYMDNLSGRMKMHPLKLENFTGRLHIEDEHIVVESLSGKMGNTSFKSYINYYYGEDPAIKKRDNLLKITADRIDYNELINYEKPAQDAAIDHDSVFNLYTLPFPDMKFEADIRELNYHDQTITGLLSRFRTTKDHYIYIDQMDLDVAGGHIAGKGYFDGRKPDYIYLHPDFSFEKLDLTKLMLKFDNFGQDEIISDNLTGQISGNLKGEIRLHTDMVPIIEESIMEMNITVYNGVLKKFEAFLAMEKYFKDKNLNRIAFDTLQNSLIINKGKLTIPEMTVNTSIGFIVVEGTQDLDLNMDYLISVPFKMVTQAASTRLFKRKKEEIDPEQEDEIIPLDPQRKTRFVTVSLTGTPEDYKIKLSRRKKKEL
jgi:hypothetical protein